LYKLKGFCVRTVYIHMYFNLSHKRQRSDASYPQRPCSIHIWIQGYSVLKWFTLC